MRLFLTALYVLRWIKESLITSQSHQTPNLDLIQQLGYCSCIRKLIPQPGNPLNVPRGISFRESPTNNTWRGSTPNLPHKYYNGPGCGLIAGNDCPPSISLNKSSIPNAANTG